MNFTKVFSLFALLTLAVLSVSAVSAVPDTCLSIGSTTFPTSAVNNQVTFTASFNLVHNAGNCADRTITAISLTSSTGSWSSVSSTPTLPFTMDDAINNPILLTSTFTIPSSSTGVLTTILQITSNTSSSGTPFQTNLTLPNVTVTPSSSSLSISVSGTQPFLVGTNATLNIANPNGLAVTMSEIGSSLFGVTFSPSTFSATTQPVQAILSNLQNLKFGTNTVNVQASAGTQTTTASFQVRKTFCSVSPVISNLSIKSIDVSNDGEGDENEWELLDELEIELEIENNNQDDDIDTIIELGLFDNEGKNIADDLEFTSDSDSDSEEIDINIDEDDSATVNFKFKVPADFDTGSYRLAFKAYDDDAGESKSCRDVSSDLDEGFFESIDVKEASDEGRFVVIDDFNIESQVVCGSTLSGQFTIFNIGEEDQDRVNVIIKNNELNINEEVEFTSDLDQGDEETLSFSVRIPSTASNGIKQLEFITEYDYKNGVYREDSEESFNFPIEIIGCSQNLGGSGSVSGLTNTNIEAELSSEALAGQELVITSTITNTGTSSRDYTIDSRGYSEWAEITDISDESFTLDAGESKEIVFKFLVNEDASGSQAFDIQLSSEGKVQVQEVEVELTSPSKGFSFDLKGNSTLWIIGLVNVVLILLIVVVAVRLSRK